MKNNNENKKKTIIEEFYNTSISTMTSPIYSIFHLILGFFALYLSWKCNENAFNLLSVLFACCCPYFYIAYVLVTRGGCGIFGGG